MSTAMTTNAAKLTDDQLTSLAAKGQLDAQAAAAEQERRQAERVESDREAQRVQAQRVLDMWKDIDARFASEGYDAEKLGLAAVQARDIGASLNAYLTYRASTYSRNVVRSAAIGAHNILGTDPHGIINLTIYGVNFTEWLSELVERVATSEGYDAGELAIGEE